MQKVGIAPRFMKGEMEGQYLAKEDPAQFPFVTCHPAPDTNAALKQDFLYSPDGSIIRLKSMSIKLYSKF